MTIMEKVQAHYTAACEKYGEDNILGTFLYGSQNYGLASDTSDVDTKTIYIPTFEDLVKSHKVNKTLSIDEEKNEVKDIRDMFANIKKQNINFVEILFTEYAVINPKYFDYWESFKTYKEYYARWQPNIGVTSMSCQARHTLEQAFTAESGYQKKISNAVRLLYFIEQYLKDKPYLECIHPDEKVREKIYELKYGTYDKITAEFLVNTLLILLEPYTSYAKEKPEKEFELPNGLTLDEYTDRVIKEIIKLNL